MEPTEMTMETKEQRTNTDNPVVPSNEFDLKRTEIRCRDDLALKRLDVRLKSIGIIYAVIWAVALITIVYVIASHCKQ